MTLPRLPDNPLYDLILLALLLALLFGTGLADRPYSVPSESRYVEIGREMAESGDFVTPRLNYVKYFEKPPLFYWIQAEATRHLGLTPFTARIPTAFFAVLLCLITYGLGRVLYGRLAGWISALTLATSLYMFALSRIVLLDVPVSVFIVATLTAFLYAANAPDGRRRVVVLYSMYVAAACAVLTKGLIGAVLPGAVIFLWMALTNRWKLLANLRLMTGTALFLLIAVPWHILVSLRNPEFPHFYFIHEHFERYFTKEHGRYQEDWFFLAVLIAGLFPWIAFAGQAIARGLAGFWRTRLQNGAPLFLLIWIAFILTFFSLSDSKLIPYILPVFPPIAVFIGGYFAAAWREKPVPAFGFGLSATILLFFLMAIGPTLLMQFMDPASKVIIALKQGGDEAQYLSIASMILAGLLLIAAIQGRKRHVIVMLLVAAALLAQLGDGVGAHYNKDSMQTLAGTIKKFHKPGDEVASYATYYQDLPIYLERRITVVNWKGELEFGTEHENTSAWIINDKEFWRRWFTPDHLMFAVMREESYIAATKGMDAQAMHLYALQQDGRNILFMNQLPEMPKPEEPKKDSPKKDESRKDGGGK